MSAPKSIVRQPSTALSKSPDTSLPESLTSLSVGELDNEIEKLKALRHKKHHGHKVSSDDGKSLVRNVGTSESYAFRGDDDPSSHGSTTLIHDAMLLEGPQALVSSSMPAEFQLSKGLAPRLLKATAMLGDSNSGSLETKIMGTMYDQVFSALTYSPSAAVRPFLDIKEEYFIMADKGVPVEKSAFNNLVSPLNPNGDFGQSQYFSSMVNTNSYIQDGLEAVYDNIINAASAKAVEDPEKAKTYQKAYDYLYATTSVTDFMGNSQTTISPTPIYASYLEKQSAYNSALSGYRVAFNSYDMKKTSDQRLWLAQEPQLKSVLDRSYNEFRNAAPFVEQAQSALNSLGQSLAATTISKSKAVFDQTSLTSMTQGAAPWHLCYSFPQNWTQDDASFAEVSVDSSKLHETSSAESTKWGGSANLNLGFFRIGGGADSSSSKEQSHMDATQVNIKFKMGIVRISRPWFRDSLFSIGNWNLPGEKKASISSHNMDDASGKLIPSYPTGFVVVKEVEITANWSEKDRTTLQSSFQASASAGWGPFSISGQYAHSSKSDDFTASMQGQTVKIPGMQIIGWINKIVPVSPQIDG